MVYRSDEEPYRTLIGLPLEDFGTVVRHFEDTALEIRRHIYVHCIGVLVPYPLSLDLNVWPNFTSIKRYMEANIELLQHRGGC